MPSEFLYEVFVSRIQRGFGVGIVGSFTVVHRSRSDYQPDGWHPPRLAREVGLRPTGAVASLPVEAPPALHLTSATPTTKSLLV
jgi:hypothetical protein